MLVRRSVRFLTLSVALLAFAVSVVQLALSSIVSAQVTTATIVGTVTDSAGATVAKAEIVVTSADSGLTRVVYSESDGTYRIELLPVGNYSLSASAQGFKKFERKEITLTIDQTARIDASLEVGAATETVNVTDTPPTVNTSTTEIGRTVENTEIVNLPIVNRNVYTLLSLTPGVQQSVNTIVLGYPEQRTFINGGADGGAGSVSYYLDGGINMTGLRNTGNILPNPDAIQEFRVETSNFNALYGRMSGGVVTVLTKSGSNTWHGSLFEFYRDAAFNANTWGNITSGTPPLHRNQFGGTVGGPIIKDKTFFFFSYQGLRQVTSAFMTGATVPTTLERTGNFTQSVFSGNPVTLPSQYTCGTANVICPSLLDPAAMKIISTFIPTAIIGTNGWQGAIPSPYQGDDFLLKVDHSLTKQHRLTVSYFETSGNNTVVPSNSTTGLPNGNLPWASQLFNWRQQNASLTEAWTINSNLVNEARLTYMRNFAGRLNLPQTSLGDLGSAFTIQGAPSLPQITVTNYFTLASAIAGPIAGTNLYALRDVVSYIHGRHAFAFGAETSLDKDIQQTLLNNYGVFGFNSNVVKSTATAANVTVPPLVNFELGLPTSVSQDAPVTGYTNSFSTGVFIQDDFRVLPRLTLNLGLRWDVQTPPTDPQNREDTFVAGVQSIAVPAAPKGQLFVGDPAVTRGTVPVRWHHVSPRVGIAWDPFGDGKTAVRLGAGVFYGSVAGNEWNTDTNFQPFSTRFTFTNVTTALNSSGKPTGASLSNPYNNLAGGDPFPYIFNPANPKFIPGAGIFGFSPNFQWPYSYQFNLSVQRQITSDFSVQLSYISTLSHDLPFAIDQNYPVFLPSATSASGNILARRPVDNPNVGVSPSPLGAILLVQSNQTASYHGAQLTATKRMSRHFLVNGFYTFSKTLSSVQLDNNTTQGGAEDVSKLFLDKGRTDFDMRHMFVASGVWQISYYNGERAALRHLLNGWSISPIVTLRSGSPFTILDGSDANLDGNSTDRAQLVAGVNPVLDPHRSRAAVAALWFNTAAFSKNAATSGVFIDGNSARNLLDGPGYRNVDLAIFRDIKIGEKMALQLRLEATNAFNLVSLQNPTGNGATVGSGAAFGKITSAAPMRQLQLGARITF
ncbi:MAG TPA: carboxypeptidase regulatory-like domain-containing protein [Candidatus Sulfotelmatobacter sp.]|nr:carboxypeptidase regulatory-like domain-containing protein [Candidatus Sulfotelmatobacter sp.]